MYVSPSGERSQERASSGSSRRSKGSKAAPPAKRSSRFATRLGSISVPALVENVGSNETRSWCQPMRSTPPSRGSPGGSAST